MLFGADKSREPHPLLLPRQRLLERYPKRFGKARAATQHAAGRIRTAELHGKRIREEKIFLQGTAWSSRQHDVFVCRLMLDGRDR